MKNVKECKIQALPQKIFLGFKRLKEFYEYLKGWCESKRKVMDLTRTEEFHLKSEASDSGKILFRGLSFEGGPIESSLGENKNMTEIMPNHKLTEDLEILGSSKEQLTLESKIMSQNNSGVFEMKFDGEEQGKDELIIENLQAKSVDWSKNNSGIRKVNIQRRRIPPQLNGLSVGDIFGEGKLEGSEVLK